MNEQIITIKVQPGSDHILNAAVTLPLDMVVFDALQALEGQADALKHLTRKVFQAEGVITDKQIESRLKSLTFQELIAYQAI